MIGIHFAVTQHSIILNASVHLKGFLTLRPILRVGGGQQKYRYADNNWEEERFWGASIQEKKWSFYDLLPGPIYNLFG